MINWNSAASASWIFGSVLLVYLMCILAVVRNPLGVVKVRLIGFFCALLSGFFAYFFIGDTGGVDFKSAKLQASGAVAIFLIVLGLSWRKEIFPADVAPLPEGGKLRQEAAAPGSQKRVAQELARGTAGQKANAKHFRRFAIGCFCLTLVAVGVLFSVGTRSGISIETIPPYDFKGGDTTRAYIAGSSTALNCENYYVVIYALTEKWHVQPMAGKESIVDLGRDSQWHYCRWGTWTHTGTHYAALLVLRSSAFHPDEIINVLPGEHGIVARAVVEGIKSEK